MLCCFWVLYFKSASNELIGVWEENNVYFWKIHTKCILLPTFEAIGDVERLPWCWKQYSHSNINDQTLQNRISLLSRLTLSHWIILSNEIIWISSIWAEPTEGSECSLSAGACASNAGSWVLSENPGTLEGPEGKSGFPWQRNSTAEGGKVLSGEARKGIFTKQKILEASHFIILGVFSQVS